MNGTALPSSVSQLQTKYNIEKLKIK